MRRPVIAMCAALAALAIPLSASMSAPSSAAASAAPRFADGGSPTGHRHQRALADGTAAARTAARTAAVSAARSKARKAQRRKAADATPLSVTIDQLTPSTMPARGRIHISGFVTNHDTSTWTNINVYAFVSAEPMTTSTELADAVRTDPSTFVGDRICADGACNYYDTIASLAPGEQEQYSFSVPRKLLGATTPGVYWFGVHALGESPDGRDSLADGRARTFLPLVPQSETNAVPTALVIPLRRPLTYADDGSLSDLAGWLHTLQAGGQLRALVDFGAGAGNRTVDWVIDPALVDAVRHLAAGNSPRSLLPNLVSGQADGEPTGTSSPGPSGSDQPAGQPTTQPAAQPSPAADVTKAPPSPLDLNALDPVTEKVAAAAQSWLDRLTAAVRPGDQVLALPYGDTDVAAAARHNPRIYQRARTRADSEQLLPGVTATPVVASPSGFLSAAGLRLVDPDTTVLVTDGMFHAPAPSLADIDGRQVVVTSSGGAAGGPGPDDPTSMTAMRQRLLAEAAVRVLQPDPAPLVVMLPHDWNPSDPAAYFSGLDAAWLDLTSVAAAAGRASATPVLPGLLHYPKSQLNAELDAVNFTSADQLMAAGDSLQSLLTFNNIVSGTVADEALGTTSYSARSHPDASRADADRSRDWIDAKLALVHVTGPQAVTLSSSTGKFGATLINGLDQPVTVRIVARTDHGLRIGAPSRVDVAASGQTGVLLNAHAAENGVHEVTLMVTDKRGVPLGGTTELSIRSAQVSNIIWLIMAIGAALLFGTIGLRLFRRIRAARRSPPSDGDAPAGARPTDDGSEAKEPAGAGTR